MYWVTVILSHLNNSWSLWTFMIVGLYYFKILPEAETHSIFSGTCNSKFERKFHFYKRGTEFIQLTSKQKFTFGLVQEKNYISTTKIRF